MYCTDIGVEGLRERTEHVSRRQCLRGDLNFSRNLIGFKLQASFFLLFCGCLVYFMLGGWLAACILDLLAD